MLNKVILVGRVATELEMRYTQQGTAVSTFSMAVHRKYNKEQTDFIKIKVWSKQAERCAEYLSKGRLVMIEGSLRVDSYEDREGNKRKSYEVVADTVRFLDKPKDGNNNSGQYKGKHTEKKDPWDDVGRELSTDEVDFMDGNGNFEDEVPF